MNRRQLLLAGGAALSLGRCARPFATMSPVAPPQTVHRSQSGRLELALTAAPARVNLAGRMAQVLAYNGQVPGPRIEVQGGDQVVLRFTNQLDQPTNLHFHGLAISPTDLGDNPFRRVAPGETATYRFTIAADAPGGLAWYHPHYHGQVAPQVGGGLVGLWVVRGAVDQIPAIQATTETFLVLQDFALDRRGTLQPPSPMAQLWGREGNHMTVNGQPPPTLSLATGGLLRLRLLNGSPSRFYRLRLGEMGQTEVGQTEVGQTGTGHPWWLVATDSHPLAAPVALDTLLLAPGERAEVLVPGQATPGTYALVSLPYDRGMGAMEGQRIGGGHPGPGMASEPVPLAYVQYQGEQSPVALPTALVPVPPLPAPDQVRELVFDHGYDPSTQAQFLINGQGFDHHRVDTTVALGTVEDWIIINNAGMDHPFHLHTHPFQVVSRNGQPDPYPAWRDLVNVPPYSQVRLRIPFRTFAGKTVYHCHILDHGDQGMMGTVAVV